MDGNRANLDGEVFKHPEGIGGTGIHRLHGGSLACSDDVLGKLIQNISAHCNNLGTSVQDTLWLKSWCEGREDDAEREEAMALEEQFCSRKTDMAAGISLTLLGSMSSSS